MTSSTRRFSFPAYRRQFFVCSALCGALSALGGRAVAGPELLLSEAGGGGLPNVSQTLGRTDVQLNAPRTIMTWDTYNVAAGETVSYNFGARNWIVVNRLLTAQPAKIDGVVEGRVGGAYGGNIWFATRGGVIFGAGARVDAGGLLFTASDLNRNAFLDPGRTEFDFSGVEVLPTSAIIMKDGALINGHGGLVALVAPSVVTGANTQVNSDGGGSVLVGASDSYQLRLTQTVSGDFDLVDFIVPSASSGSGAGVAIDLQSSITANSVFVAAVTRTGLASAVVNLEGLITAQAATADGGDIILSGGGGIIGRQPGSTVGTVDTDIYLNRAVAARDLKVVNRGQIFGRPWARPLKPPEEVVNDPTDGGIAECIENPSLCTYDEFDNGYGNSYDPCYPNGCHIARLPEGLPTGAVANLTVTSQLTVGRDSSLTATRNIDIGRLSAVRDVTITAASAFANQLGAGRDLKVTTQGQTRLAATAVGRNGLISATDVTMDGLTTGAGVTSIQATGDIFIGDGASVIAGQGVVNLTAGRNVLVGAGDARLGTVTAGQAVSLRGGALNIDKVSGSSVTAQSESLRIGEVTSAGDVYLFASRGDAVVGKATAGDDIFIVATQGTGSLGAGVLTGQGQDIVSTDFVGNPDTGSNGRTLRVEGGANALLGLGTGGVTGAGSAVVKAGADAIVDVTQSLPRQLQITAGRDATLRAPTASIASIQAGRDITLAATAGDFTASQTLTAARNLSITASGAVTVSDVQTNAGSATLAGASVTAGSVTASEDIVLRATGGSVTTTSYRAGRDLTVEANSLSLGAGLAPIGRDLTITSGADFTTSQLLTATRNVSVTAAGALQLGDVRTDAGSVSLTGRSVTAGAVTAGLDVTLKAAGGSVTTASFRTGRDLFVEANALSLGSALASVGRDLTITTGTGFNAASDLAVARNLTLNIGGAANLRNVSATGGALQITAGSLTSGALSGQSSVRVDVAGAANIASASGPTLVVNSGSLTSAGTLAASIGQTLTVAGAANLGSASAPTLRINAGSLNVTGQLSAPTLLAVTTTGAATVAGANAGTAQFTAGDLALTGPGTLQTLTVDVQNRASLGTVNATTARVLARDLDVTGIVTAGTLQVESRAGALRIGGAASDPAPGGGMWIDNGEFGRFRVSGLLRIYGGSTTGTARGDITVQNLDVNPAQTPQVSLLAGSGQTVFVQGVAAPTTSGGVFRIGDQTDLNWRPGSILITGSLGAAVFQGGVYNNVRAFNEVRLAARQDILMGSQRFITLIQATAPEAIDIGRQSPGGVAPTPDEQFRVFLASGRLEVSADNKVVQQNTSPSVGAPVGILLNGSSSSVNGGRGDPLLTIDPPKIVDLFGAFVDPATGRVTSGPTASARLAFEVVDTSGNPTPQPAGSSYRFNACDVNGAGCAPAAMVIQPSAAIQQSAPFLSSGNGLEGAGSDSELAQDLGEAAVSSSNITNQPILIAVNPPDADTIATDPVIIGAGSEEIWRERRQKKQ